MSHFHAIPDVVAVTADRLVAIVRVGVDGSVVVRDLAYGALSTTSAAELSVPPALRDPTVAPVQSIVQATDAQWARARRREAVIAGLANADDLGDQVTRACARLGISRRTVFRWLAAYRDTPQTSSLLARRRGTPSGARRIDARLEDLIAEVIRNIYLTKVRAKKADPQIASRFEPFALPRWRESAGLREFVVSFGRLLPLHLPSPFGDKDMILKLMASSGGLTGKITTVLAQAAELAIRQNRMHQPGLT